MKRLFFVVAAVITAAAFIPVAVADCPYDYVVGAGERSGNPEHFEVGAQTRPIGAFGQYQVMFANGQAATMNVTCLYVVGNRATVGGVITRAVPSTLEGLGLATAFEDNGNPVAGVTPDRQSGNDVFSEPGRTPPMTLADCIAESFLLGPPADWNPMTSGNVEIHDAP